MAKRERKDRGPVGIADVRFMTKSIRVTFKDGDSYDLPLEATEKGRKSGTYRVVMTAAKDKMYLGPGLGQYVLSFKEFGYRANGVPMNNIQRGGPRQRKDGKGTWFAEDELVYSAIFQIEDHPLYGGLNASINIPYIFARIPGSTDSCDFDGKPYQLKRNEKFFWAAGKINIAMDPPFDYDENPSVLLARIEKLLQHKNLRLLGNIDEKGFLDLYSLSHIPDTLLKPARKKKE